MPEWPRSLMVPATYSNFKLCFPVRRLTKLTDEWGICHTIRLLKIVRIHCRRNFRLNSIVRVIMSEMRLFYGSFIHLIV